MFTDFTYEPDKKYNAGFSMIALTALNISVNTGFVIWKSYVKVRDLVRKLVAWINSHIKGKTAKKYEKGGENKE